MFSVTNTGTNFRPLCTANVRPTASGVIVLRRDQVLMTFLLWAAPADAIFSARWPSTKAPFLMERGMDERLLGLLLSAALDDHAVGPFVVAGLEPLRKLTPWRTRMPAAGRAPLASAHGMVDRVHGHAAIVRALAEPTSTTRLADRDVLVVDVGYLADDCPALEMDHPNLTRRHPDLRIIPIFCHEGGARAGRADELAPLALLHLDVVHRRS